MTTRDEINGLITEMKQTVSIRNTQCLVESTEKLDEVIQIHGFRLKNTVPEVGSVVVDNKMLKEIKEIHKCSTNNIKSLIALLEDIDNELVENEIKRNNRQK